MANNKNARRSEIPNLLLENPNLRNEDFAKYFGVTLETIRSDMIYLEQKGIVHKLHGHAEVTDSFRRDKIHLNDRAHLDEKAKLAVAEAVIYAGELVAFALVRQMLYVVQYAVTHDNLVGFFKQIFYLFVKLVEFGLGTEILFRIGKLYFRSALFSSQVKAGGGIHDDIALFEYVEFFVGDDVSERTNFSLSVKTVGTFHIVKKVSHNRYIIVYGGRNVK